MSDWKGAIRGRFQADYDNLLAKQQENAAQEKKPIVEEQRRDNEKYKSFHCHVCGKQATIPWVHKEESVHHDPYGCDYVSGESYDVTSYDIPGDLNKCHFCGEYICEDDLTIIPFPRKHYLSNTAAICKYCSSLPNFVLRMKYKYR